MPVSQSSFLSRVDFSPEEDLTAKKKSLFRNAMANVCHFVFDGATMFSLDYFQSTIVKTVRDSVQVG